MVIIGDSQTEGNNATSGDAWPMVFGRLRNETVYSMAVGGYSPVQYAYLAEKALELHPKTLMVGFYFGNDLVEAQSLAYNLDVWRTCVTQATHRR